MSTWLCLSCGKSMPSGYFVKCNECRLISALNQPRNDTGRRSDQIDPMWSFLNPPGTSNTSPSDESNQYQSCERVTTSTNDDYRLSVEDVNKYWKMQRRKEDLKTTLKILAVVAVVLFIIL